MSKRGGFTLVEVLGATVLLGAILAGVILAHARHTRQLTLAREKNRLVQSLDTLLAGWWDDDRLRLPEVRQGTLPDREDVTWEIQEGDRTEFAARIYRIVLRKREEDEPILTIEVLADERK